MKAIDVLRRLSKWRMPICYLIQASPKALARPMATWTPIPPRQARVAEKEDPRNVGAGGEEEGDETMEQMTLMDAIRKLTWAEEDGDKRKRNDEEHANKRRNVDRGDVSSGLPFTKEEIDGEVRKPKKKVAVMVGYAGTGYKGMQVNATEKTIEGDLFQAFVAAGAISKANADDPKKSSLARCARTDKGVHAAGNVISLKLIVEDPNTVQNINEHLPPQIRVWGIERTNGGFSCYQSCDSRWYEYLIPTYSFLPPHPQSFLGKKLVESAEKEGVLDEYRARQEDVADFWENVDKNEIEPMFKDMDPELRENIMAAVYKIEEEETAKTGAEAELKEEIKDEVTEAIASNEEKPPALKLDNQGSVEEAKDETPKDREASEPMLKSEGISVKQELPDQPEAVPAEPRPLTPLEAAIKDVKVAYMNVRKAYRISEVRQKRVQEALSAYLGTCNFHNYTIQKTFKDPSAKRVIRSFNVGPKPIIINDTEWLSLKVHGQSFMMHQIRKMVAMAALVVRCGSPMSIIKESYGPISLSIPKAPSLGLLLERPIFESYNERAVSDLGREKIDFNKYQKEMDEFKQKEIYDRIFRVEDSEHQFHVFFHHIDHYRSDFFLWVTASGIAAARQPRRKGDIPSDDEVDVNGGEG
ncbi:hypothetical protein B7494_g3955 [Chlorociboria aeruginascens]|nr:hypothetical protein B7494_g3955 [Chlorociboria aeruginascens]